MNSPVCLRATDRNIRINSQGIPAHECDSKCCQEKTPEPPRFIFQKSSVSRLFQSRYASGLPKPILSGERVNFSTSSGPDDLSMLNFNPASVTNDSQELDPRKSLKMALKLTFWTRNLVVAGVRCFQLKTERHSEIEHLSTDLIL